MEDGAMERETARARACLHVCPGEGGGGGEESAERERGREVERKTDRQSVCVRV